MLACHDEEKKEKSQGEPGEWVATSRKRLQAPGLEDPDFQQRPQQWQRWQEVSAGASSTSKYSAPSHFPAQFCGQKMAPLFGPPHFWGSSKNMEVGSPFFKVVVVFVAPRVN